MNKFNTWYVTNQDAITWFIIGWMGSAGLFALSQGDYEWAAIDFAIVGANYMFRRARVD